MENSGRGEKSPAKVVLDGMRVFHLFVHGVTFDTSFRLSRPFFGRWNRFVQMVNAKSGTNLPALNFAYHLPKQ